MTFVEIIMLATNLRSSKFLSLISLQSRQANCLLDFTNGFIANTQVCPVVYHSSIQNSSNVISPFFLYHHSLSLIYCRYPTIETFYQLAPSLVCHQHRVSNLILQPAPALAATSPLHISAPLAPLPTPELPSQHPPTIPKTL